MKDASLAERVCEVDQHQAERLLRAWLRGDQHPEPVDVELLQDPDVVRLAASLRECARDGCLTVDEVRGVADLVVHVASAHGVGRLGDGTARAFGLLTEAMHGCNLDALASQRRSHVPPPPVMHAGPPLWAVNTDDTSLGTVVGWIPEAFWHTDDPDELPDHGLQACVMIGGYCSVTTGGWMLYRSEQAALAGQRELRARFAEVRAARSRRRLQALDAPPPTLGASPGSPGAG